MTLITDVDGRIFNNKILNNKLMLNISETLLVYLNMWPLHGNNNLNIPVEDGRYYP